MTVLLFQGGSSVERDVSFESAAYVEKILTEMGHTVKTITVDCDGSYSFEGRCVFISPASGLFTSNGKIEADVAFPMIHGHGGEDGTLQSLLECAHIAYVSEDIATSALCMHKSLANDIFTANGLTTPLSLVLSTDTEYTDNDIEYIFSCLGTHDVVLKPEAGGSSIGVHIIKNASADDIRRALSDVAEYDVKALVQEYIHSARELEAGVFADPGTGNITVMGPVEVATDSSFLDYESKYSDASRIIEADKLGLSEEKLEEIRMSAITAFEAVKGSSYMRVDFLYSEEKLYINEINTIPGMTKHSHFPAIAGGKHSLMMVFDLLIQGAIRRFERENSLKRSL